MMPQPQQQTFASAAVLPTSLDAKSRTIDCVWYGGQSVDRTDPNTGKPYKLRLDMAGCNMDRLNAGAAVFDGHMNGGGLGDYFIGKPGMAAQIGCVQKAWAEGGKGMASLQFLPEGQSESADRIFNGIRAGVFQNLSFGTFIYRQEADDEAPGMQTGAHLDSTDEGADQPDYRVARSWQPFEVSIVPVPADCSTEFLSTAPPANFTASAQSEILALGKTHNLPELANRLIAEGSTAAAAKVAFETAILTHNIGMRMVKHGAKEDFIMSLVNNRVPLPQAREAIMEHLENLSQQDALGNPFHLMTASVEMDASEKRFTCMQAAMLLRANPQHGMARKLDPHGHQTAEFVAGHGPALQQQLEQQARAYRGASLMDMARESLEMRGINTRTMSRREIAARSLSLDNGRVEQFGMSGAETTSDFPNILADVANKTLRQSYQSYPQTFKAFARQVTATDFKPINRVQLSDAPPLEMINEKGEYRRGNLSDTNQSYVLNTYGRTLAITRKVIINDDLQAFVRLAMAMGGAAARMESDVVYSVLTSNQVMGEDNKALFHVDHGNLVAGGGSALSLAAMGTSRSLMRLQTAQQGTPLNLTARYLLVPTSLENSALQLIYPTQLAAATVVGVVPSWITNLVPLVEPRLDANSSTAWYLIADNSMIDTIEYCYLEGQEGIYLETRQGFEVDGIEIKAREDFAAAAIDFRGMQKNVGA